MPMHNFSQKTMSIKAVQPADDFIKDMGDEEEPAEFAQFSQKILHGNAQSNLMVSSNKVSRPLTAYYSGRIGSSTT